MDEKEGGKGTNVRLDDSDRQAINQLVDDGEYESISAFVRQAVKDKLNPKLRRARTVRDLLSAVRIPETNFELRRLLGLI